MADGRGGRDSHVVRGLAKASKQEVGNRAVGREERDECQLGRDGEEPTRPCEVEEKVGHGRRRRRKPAFRDMRKGHIMPSRPRFLPAKNERIKFV